LIGQIFKEKCEDISVALCFAFAAHARSIEGDILAAKYRNKFGDKWTKVKRAEM